MRIRQWLAGGTAAALMVTTPGAAVNSAPSDQTRLFAEGGDVVVRSLTVRPLRSVWR